MIGYLFTDKVAVGFDNGVISFVIKANRACMDPQQIRDRDMFPLFHPYDPSYSVGNRGDYTY